jgi:hypothetical protein
MPQEYRTLRVAPAGEGVLIGPELVRDLYAFVARLSQRIAELYPSP